MTEPTVPECDVNWGSHGCALPPRHDDYCRCDCADDGPGDGAFPYFGPKTVLYGRDVLDAWGLDGDAPDVQRPISESPRWQAAATELAALREQHPDHKEVWRP